MKMANESLGKRLGTRVADQKIHSRRHCANKNSRCFKWSQL